MYSGSLFFAQEGISLALSKKDFSFNTGILLRTSFPWLLNRSLLKFLLFLSCHQVQPHSTEN